MNPGLGAGQAYLTRRASDHKTLPAPGGWFRGLWGPRPRMDDVLFIKTSSLGDVIHHMPAVTDAWRIFPHARFAWVTEEPYAPLVKLHPAIAEVIPVAARRWRNGIHRSATWREMGAFRRRLRERSYDAIVDTQGLFRTGVLAKTASGHRHGYHADSVRERGAAMFYDEHHSVPRKLHAVERNRILTGLALGYKPVGGPDFGLDRERFRDMVVRPYAVLLHATAQRKKEWPEENWVALGRALERRGVDLLLPWGNAAEHARATRIADKLKLGRVPVRRPLDDMARMIAGAEFVVGVDTGLVHLAAALGVPLVAIFLDSAPELTGALGNGPIEIVAGRSAPPTVDDVLAAVGRIAPS